jgi:hypothetical protein
VIELLCSGDDRDGDREENRGMRVSKHCIVLHRSIK